MKNADTLLPFMLENTSLRGRIVRLDDSLNSVLKGHDYPEPVASSLAEIVIMASLLAATLKFEGILTVQAMGEGAVSTIVSDITHDGAIRGYVAINDEKYAELMKNRISASTKELLGDNCFIAITVDKATSNERYQGLVKPEGDTVIDWMRHYFNQSEQIQTGFKTALRKTDNGNLEAGAVMIQTMPSDGGIPITAVKSDVLEDDWRRVMMILETLTENELLSDTLSTEDVLLRLFHEDGVRVFDTLNISHICRCSEDKIRDVLQSLPPDDIREIEKNGMIEISCRFCGKMYHLPHNQFTDKKG